MNSEGIQLSWREWGMQQDKFEWGEWEGEVSPFKTQTEKEKKKKKGKGKREKEKKKERLRRRWFNI